MRWFRRRSESCGPSALALAPALTFCLCVAASPQVQAQSVYDLQSPDEYLQLIDSNGDGRIALGEYQDYLGRSSRDMDHNGDGMLSASELPPGTRLRNGKPVSLARQREAYAMRFFLQDRNGDRYLDATELAAPPQ